MKRLLHYLIGTAGPVGYDAVSVAARTANAELRSANLETEDRYRKRVALVLGELLAALDR